MAVAEPQTALQDLAHDDHDHGEFIAHHFHNAQQQYDSGKLGIWVFLVTEILFFSGLFVAYTLYRVHHPEIFEQAHVYLDKYLGALNTVILLFSSLTMAWAVRSAQFGRNKTCATLTLITMVCASAFLGVKAIEYTHKFDMGIFPRGEFLLLAEHRTPTTAIGQALGISDYLVYISVIPAILLVLFLIGSGVAKLTEKPMLSKFLLGLSVMVGGYFLGAAGGQLWQNATAAKGGAHAASVSAAPLVLQAATQDATANATGDNEAQHHADVAGGHNSLGGPAGGAPHVQPELSPDVGLFFSIYYCMTGLHGIHIIGGIIALAWLFWRSLMGHWRVDYFGPVDYVGLYWHLVDLIWIFLFPLLYLID